jgi:hypothetical protein
MKFLRTVTVKHVLTEEKKATMLKDFEQDISQIERELEQLKFQVLKATKELGNKQEQLLLRNRFKKEIEFREERLKSAAFKVQQLHKLEIGGEISEGTVDAIIEVEIGDLWPEQRGCLEMIVKNGIVHEFRESRNEK